MRVYTLRTEPLDELAGWLGELTRGWHAQLDSYKDFVALDAASFIGGYDAGWRELLGWFAEHASKENR